MRDSSDDRPVVEYVTALHESDAPNWLDKEGRVNLVVYRSGRIDRAEHEAVIAAMIAEIEQTRPLVELLEAVNKMITVPYAVEADQEGAARHALWTRTAMARAAIEQALNGHPEPEEVRAITSWLGRRDAESSIKNSEPSGRQHDATCRGCGIRPAERGTELCARCREILNGERES